MVAVISYFIGCLGSLLFITYLAKVMQSPWAVPAALVLGLLVYKLSRNMEETRRKQGRRYTKGFGIKLYVFAVLFSFFFSYNWMSIAWSRWAILNVGHWIYVLTGISIL